MAQRKRKHAEFATDDPGSSGDVAFSLAQTHESVPSMTTSNGTTLDSQSSLPDRSIGVGTEVDDKWKVTLSKKARKKMKKQERKDEEESMPPSLYYHNRVVNPLRIKDLQALVLYVLSDGAAPAWVAVKNGKGIDQIAVVMVPGMDRDVLSASVAAIQEGAHQSNGTHEDVLSVNTLTDSAVISEESAIGEDQTPQAKPPPPNTSANNSLLDCIIPIKAPGDSRSGKIHSPLQSMLISPEPKGNGPYKGADNVFAPVRTPVTQFVHSADELLEAQYPVHPAIFTNPKDAELERARREGGGQSSTAGWVDTQVDSSAPAPAQEQPDPSDLSGGMQVYALDCEMVLTTDDVYSLARISILNWQGKTVLDRIVRPTLPVKDYFTQFSGITEKHLDGVTTTLEDIQKELLELCTPSTILLGHSLESDLNALKLAHPFIVDTSMLYPHPRGLPLRSSLKFLANKYLKREIQKGGEDGHDSVEDAQAVLDLVKLKCEKGPKWGTMDAHGESIFARLNGSGCRTAIVEHGTPEKGLGRLATLHVGCQDDNEITEGLVRMLNRHGAREKVNFVWGRLRDMEKTRGWDSQRERYSGSAAVQNGRQTESTVDGLEESSSKESGVQHASADKIPSDDSTESALQEATDSTVSNLVRIYESLAPSTLFIVFSGPGDMQEVIRLQEMQKQYRKEFKVKRWDELTVKWTDDEVQALRKAVDQARKGWALVCLK